ncbi:MAG: SpvB/TcaC N-terminal domain-containing protein, partial [Pseudomonadota bacterium]
GSYGVSQLGNGSAPEVALDLSGEVLIPCWQMSSLIDTLGDKLVHDNDYPRLCIAAAPTIESAVLTMDDGLQLSWAPLVIPDGYDGASTVEVQIRADSQSQFFNVAAYPADLINATLNVSIQNDFYLEIRVRACRSDGVCSDWSPVQSVATALEPPTSVVVTAESNGDQTVSWAFPIIPDDIVGEYYFLLSNTFVNEERVIDATLQTEFYDSTIPQAEVADFPGGIFRVSVCRGNSFDQVRLCSSYSEGRLPTIVRDLALPAPSLVELDPIVGNSNRFELSWTVDEDPDVDYYLIEELAVDPLTGNEEIEATYAHESLSIELIRALGRPSTKVRVSSCRRELERGADYCSAPATSAETDTSATFQNFDIPHSMCWESDDPLMPTVLGGSGESISIDLDIYWQHTVSAGVEALPDAFEFNPYSTFINPTTYDVPFNTATYRAVSIGLDGVPDYGEFWKYSGTFVFHESQTGPAANPAMTVASKRGGFVINSPAAPLVPVAWDSQTGQFEFDEGTRCNFATGIGNMFPLEDGGSGREAGGPSALSPGHWVTSLPLKTESCRANQPTESGTPEWTSWANDCVDPSPGVSTGWQFYWSSSLRVEEHGGDDANAIFGKSYDLIGFWQTYRRFGNDWRPVWYYGRFQAQESETEEGVFFAEGALMYPRRQAPDVEVGTVRVNFSPGDVGGGGYGNRDAEIYLNFTGGGGLSGEHTFEIRDWLLDDLVWDPNAFGTSNEHDHYNGIWAVGTSSGGLYGDVSSVLDNAEFFVSEWTVDDIMTQGLFGFDSAGDPIWAIGNLCNGALNDGSCDGSQPVVGNRLFHGANNYVVIEAGIDPVSVQETGIEHLIAADRIESAPLTGGTGFSRQYVGTSTNSAWLDRRSGKACVDLSASNIGGSGRSLNFSVGDSDGSCSSTSAQGADMLKLANNHYIGYRRPALDQSGECSLDLNCRVDLTWFTDGEYDDTSIQVRNTSSGATLSLEQVCLSPLGDPVFFDAYSQYRAECQLVQEGQFVFQLIANYPGSTPSSVIAESEPLLVGSGNLITNPVTPLEPAPPPNFDVTCAPGQTGCSDIAIARAESSEVGQTAGQFEVDPSGSANYTIPIMVASGRGGFAPQLSLMYNHRNGTGPLGTGWTITGTSTIQRCDQGVEFGDDQNRGVRFDDDDRFCLDGRRLLLVGTNDVIYGDIGTEYRLEGDPSVRVELTAKSGDQPSEFLVERPGGHLAIYGSAASNSTSRIEVPLGSDNKIYSWPISFEYDAFQNEISYEYLRPSAVAGSLQGDDAEYLIKRVSFNPDLTPGATEYLSYIEFHYEPIPIDQQSTGYLAGVAQSLTQRLSGIQSSDHIEGRVREDIRAYSINYDDGLTIGNAPSGQFVVSSITECDRYIDPAHCFEPTTFDWDNNLGTSFSATSAVLNESGQAIVFNDGHAPHSVYPIDIDGNGRQDVVLARKVGDDIELTAYLISDNQRFSQIGGTHVANCWEDDDTEFGLSPVDFDGDGQQSLVYPYTCRGNETATTTKMRQVNFELQSGSWRFATVSPPDLELSERLLRPRLQITDFNGDTIPDLIVWDDDVAADVSSEKPIVISPGVMAANDAAFSFPSVISLPFFVMDDGECSAGGCYIGARRARLDYGSTFGIDGDGTTAFLIEKAYSVCQGQEPRRRQVDEFGRTGLIGDGEDCVRESATGVWTIEYDEQNRVYSLQERFTLAGIDTEDRLFVNDVNGDGLVDISYLETDGDDERDLFTALGTGAESLPPPLQFEPGFLPAQLTYTIQWPQGLFNRYQSLRMADFNGDGRHELMFPSNAVYDDAYWQVIAWDPVSGMFTQSYNGPSTTSLSTGAVWDRDRDAFIDLKGDGRPDHLLVTEWEPDGNQSCNNAGNGETWKLCKATNLSTQSFFPQPGLAIKRIETGLGHVTEVVYGSTQESDLYRADVNNF